MASYRVENYPLQGVPLDTVSHAGKAPSPAPPFPLSPPCLPLALPFAFPMSLMCCCPLLPTPCHPLATPVLPLCQPLVNPWPPWDHTPCWPLAHPWSCFPPPLAACPAVTFQRCCQDTRSPHAYALHPPSRELASCSLFQATHWIVTVSVLPGSAAAHTP